MLKRGVTLLCVVAVSVMTLTGCSWTQRGALVGGGVGAGVGALIGHHSSKCDPCDAALIGLGAGALAGALLGDLIDIQNMRALEARVAELEGMLAARQAELDAKTKELAAAQARIAELEREVAELRKKLGEVKVVGDEIIISLLGETLYAPGKAELTAQGRATLDKAMGVIREQFPDREIVVRGHTDNQPIRYSGWKSNWELGAARSLGVLHYLMDKHGVKGENISAATYSYYRPVADNASPEGRQQNRRAEIVILPKRVEKIERPG
jgi:flagellar motor protein MotB